MRVPIQKAGVKQPTHAITIIIEKKARRVTPPCPFCQRTQPSRKHNFFPWGNCGSVTRSTQETRKQRDDRTLISTPYISPSPHGHPSSSSSIGASKLPPPSRHCEVRVTPATARRLRRRHHQRGVRPTSSSLLASVSALTTTALLIIIIRSRPRCASRRSPYNSSLRPPRCCSRPPRCRRSQPSCSSPRRSSRRRPTRCWSHRPPRC
ncbi:unnamed protein product [Ectocarpus fasciculatus]